jgi:PAS domain-containing protein
MVIDDKFLTDTEELQEDLGKLLLSLKSLKHTAAQVSLESRNTSAQLRDKLHLTTFRFFSVIDSIPDVLIIKDEHGKWKTLNKSGQILHDLKFEDYYQKTDEELADILGYSELELVRSRQMDELAWEAKHYVRYTETMRIKDKLLYLDIIKTPTFFEDGRKHELIVIGRDITSVISAELKNKACYTALNSASDIIIICDKVGKITFCNDSFLTTFGFDDFNEIQDNTLSIICSGKMPPGFFQDMWQTIKMNKPWSGTIVNKCKNNNFINCFVNVLPVMNGDPEPIYYICMMKILKDAVFD